MAVTVLTRGTTLPDSSAKSDFHNLVDTATGVTTGIVNADIDASAAIANSKLNLATVAQNVSFTGTVGLAGVVTLTSKIFKFAKGADVASAAGTITLGEDGNFFDITGTLAITSITAKAAGTNVILQFDSTASLVDASNLKLNGNFVGATGSTIQLVSDGTNWFEVSRSPSVSALNTFAGSVVQVVNVSLATLATCSALIPDDDTKPQIGEGTEVLTVNFTPKSASNELMILSKICAGSNATSPAVASLYNGANDPLSSSWFSDYEANDSTISTIHHFMDSWGTDEKAVSVRIGGVGTQNLYFNGSYSSPQNRKMGGAITSSLTIIEIKG